MWGLVDVRTLAGREAMGGKKIGASDVQGVGSPAPQVAGGARLMTTAAATTAGKAPVGYAGIVKMGIMRESRELLESSQATSQSSSSLPLDPIGESGGCSTHTNGGNNSGVASSGSECAEHDSSPHDVERPVDEALSKLSVKCGEIMTATDPKLGSMKRPPVECLAGDAETGGSSERNMREMVENCGSGSHLGQDQWSSGVDFKAQEVRPSQQQQPMLGMEYELHRSTSQPERDFRPPSLILPHASNLDSEFTANCQEQETVDAEYRPMKSYLPVSLVMSPHEVKNLLDPNAQEFTPSPTPCPSPSPASIMSIVQPSPYHIDQHAHVSYAPGAVKIGPVMYSGDHSRAPVVPLYPNGAPLYGALPGSQSSWDAQQLGLGMQGSELSHPHMGSGSVGPLAPAAIGQHPSHLMGPYVPGPTMNSFISSGCSPSIGSPSGSVSAFAVPPPLTGREHVSRALLLSGVPTELTDYSLQQELEQWGLVRALGLERRHEGLVTAHFYDLRHAKEALRDIQHQHLLQQQRIQQKFQRQMQRQRSTSSSSSGGGHAGGVVSAQNQERAGNGLDKGKQPAQDSAQEPSIAEDMNVNPPPARGLIGGKAVWAQYTMAGGPAAGLDSHNQGTLVVFNLDVDMPLDELRAAFEAYGAVKELRETPAKRQHKFVEYFDVRDAARALAALDGHEIGGKRVKIEFSRPGGQARRARAQAQAQMLAAAAAAAAAQQRGGGGGGSLGSMVPFVGNRLNTAAIPGAIQGQPMYLGWGADPSMGGPAAHCLEGPPGLHPQYMWTTNYQHHPIAPLGALVQQQQWNVGHAQQQLQPFVYQMPIGGPGGAPSASSAGGLISFGSEGGIPPPNRQLGGRGHGYGGSNVSGFHAGVSGLGVRCNNNHNGGNSMATGRGGCDEPSGRRRRGGAGSSSSSGGAGSSSSSNGSILKMDLTCLPSGGREGKQPVQHQHGVEGPRESPRKCGHAPKSSPREHAQYVFHADQVDLRNSETARTTLMIKNIPNKYSQAMLLTLLDQHCVCCNSNIVDPSEPQSGYDFVYLPIDFKNRCNLGYAFVNFTSVQATLKLYKCFHAQQWEAFNSRKVCQVTYARVQGRAALEEHFRNSRFACDTDEYLPLVFSPPRTGIVCPPPIVAAGHIPNRSLIGSPRGEEGSSSGAARSSSHNRIVDVHDSLAERNVGVAAGNAGGGNDGNSAGDAQMAVSTERNDDSETSGPVGGSSGGGSSTDATSGSGHVANRSRPT